MKQITGLLIAGIMSLILVACPGGTGEPYPGAANGPDHPVDREEVAEDVNTPATDAGTQDKADADQTVSKAPAEAVGIQNNNSYFVGIDGKVYFRVPNMDGMRKVTLWDSFLSGINGDTVLMAYDTNSGNLEFVRNDIAAWGPMSLCGDFLFYNNNSEETGYGTNNLTTPGIYGEHEDPLNTDGQQYLCGSDDGKYFVAIKYYNEVESDILVYSEESNGSRAVKSPVDNYHTTVGIAGNCFLYIACELDANDAWEYFLWSLDLDTLKVTKLGRLPEIDGEQFPGEIDQFEGDDNGNVCFSYSCYEGTGHFLYKTFAVVANAHNADSLVSSELQITEEESTPTFALDSAAPGFKLTDGIPNSAGFKDGKIGYFDAAGKFNALADAQMWDSDDSTENVVCYEQCGYVYGDVYAVRDTLVRYPNLDIGWREAYYREMVEIVKFDGTTGEEEIITVVDAPLEMNSPVTLPKIIGKWKLESFSVESDIMNDAEEMGENEILVFKDDWTVDYSLKTQSGATVDETFGVEDNFPGLKFVYEQEFGPKTFHVTGINPEGYLVLQIQFYYGDGTTSSEYALYKQIYD